MAGNLNSDSVIWTVGDTTGKAPGGAAADIPGDGHDVIVASGVPSGAPNGSPLYVDNVNDDLYIWAAAGWKGPYNLGS
jgi:hypothetical protein